MLVISDVTTDTKIHVSAHVRLWIEYAGVYMIICICTHYYKTGLCSRPFVPAAFGPGTIGGFCPGSNG